MSVLETVIDQSRDLEDAVGVIRGAGHSISRAFLPGLYIVGIGSEFTAHQVLAIAVQIEGGCDPLE